MESPSTRFAAMTSATGAHPLTSASLRARHMRLSDAQQPVSQVVMQRPPQKPMWTQESSFPLNPSLRGHNVAVLNRDLSNAMQLMSSPVPPPPVSRLAFLPTQYYGHSDAAIHLLPHSSLDTRVLHRSHSDYGPAMAAHPSDPRILYNYRVQGDHRGQPIAWPTTEVVLHRHPSSAPRQRSAKACKKCRRRKTKCSGGQPCTRCNARGLECEYDEKSVPRGPSKARLELRKKPSRSGSSTSRTSSPADSPECVPSASVLNGPDETSPTLAVSGHQTSADLQPPQQPPAAHNVIAPSLDDAVPLCSVDPAYYTQYVDEQLNSAPSAEGLSSAYTSASPSSLIQGYTVPDDEEAVALSPVFPDEAWHSLGYGYDFDDSDSSRPSSSHSTSSTSSWLSSSEASFASSASSAQTIWSATLPRYSAGSIPPALSTSSSESSLKDALLDRPRTSSSSSSAAPMASSADASLPTEELSRASISESGALLAAMSSDALAFAGSHPAIAELNLADVFSLAVDQSPEFAHGVNCLGTGGDITIKGRPSLRNLAHYAAPDADAAALGAPAPAYSSSSSSPSSFDMPQVSDAYHFPGGPTPSHAYH
ncbi:hypothetical protein PHLGIDRAFT_27457 [Phlebiopsis gigantea 11061_1 CR5-6]|uniref:Zn(2)-C6 fungal-type domain-containing protein n=1 Tax=Phlebiopsis gigantea (strain 11061_1 CR5-6) TaxID=745531 RepID=A0A0C3SFM3_PHLG1|nr:hypothetical protein PHLGIDRAFT_27457 [Phlebiopsis gigantea 11061_1 CR5-6]